MLVKIFLVWPFHGGILAYLWKPQSKYWDKNIRRPDILSFSIICRIVVRSYCSWHCLTNIWSNNSHYHSLSSILESQTKIFSHSKGIYTYGTKKNGATRNGKQSSDCSCDISVITENHKIMSGTFGKLTVLRSFPE